MKRVAPLCVFRTMNHASDDLVQEHAYTVARGVRSISLVGHLQAQPLLMMRAASRLETLCAPGAIPFVVDRGDGYADAGFASKRWALELYQWVVTEHENAVPDKQRHRVLGLLLGYSPEAIDSFEQERSGRLFSEPLVTSA